MRKILLLLTAFFLVNVGIIFAQINISDIIPSFSIKIFPEIPVSGDKINISVDSFSGINIDSASIRWSINSKIVKEGVGEKNFSFQVGESGSETEIRVDINPQKGLPFSKTIIIRPSEIDLVWEADTSVPLLYSGKSLFSRESLLRFEAIPHFVRRDKTEIPKESLIYEWRANNKLYPNSSGYGKNFFSISGSQFEQVETIEVTARSKDGGVIAKKFVKVETVSPEVLIYENNPLQGILYNRDVGSQYKLSNQEITFRAAPYYFSTKDIFSFTFDWLINGAKVSAPEKDEMTLRVEDDSAGSSRISIQVKNPKKIFQNSKKEFLINYGNN